MEEVEAASKSFIHSDVQKLTSLHFAAKKEDMQENCKLRVIGFILFKCYFCRATLTASILYGE